MKPKQNKLIIAVDFDGTIVEHRWPQIGNPAPLAIETLKEFHGAGANLILYTMRSGETLVEAVEYCQDNGIVLWQFNRNSEQIKWTSSPKVYAHVYIDDAAFGCPLIHPPNGERPYVDWAKVRKPVLEMIRERNSH